MFVDGMKIAEIRFSEFKGFDTVCELFVFFMIRVVIGSFESS